MRLPSPAALVLATVAVGLATVSVALDVSLAESEPTLIGVGAGVTAGVLAVTLVSGRTAGTIAALAVLGGWAAIAVATTDPIAPSRSSMLGVVVYLSAEAAFASLAWRESLPIRDLPMGPWVIRLAIGAVGGLVAYALLRSLDQPSESSAGLALMAVALTVVLLVALVATATSRRTPRDNRTPS